MRKTLTALGSKPDKAFVAWVALVFVLAFLASPWRRIAPVEAVQDGGLAAASQPQPQDEEGEPPSSSSDAPAPNLVDLLEDDEVIHEHRVSILEGLTLELSPVVRFEPDSSYTRELERPPLRLA
jgi:hypothetical protein